MFDVKVNYSAAAFSAFVFERKIIHFCVIKALKVLFQYNFYYLVKLNRYFEETYRV